MKLGAHVSIAGNINKAVKEAKRLKANTIQIFSGSPRGWADRKIADQKLTRFKRLARRNKISDIFIHAKYLINLASNNQELQEKSVKSLIYDLNLSRKIGAKGVVFHPHAKKMKTLVKNIKRVLAGTPQSTWLILENSAQSKLKTIGKIIRAVGNPRIKFCLDTAHLFQAGYNLASKRGREELFKIIKKEIGLENWVIIHANDSKTGLGSRHDQHADIGRGRLGLKTFSFLLNHPVSAKLPFILETPGEKKGRGHLKNIQTLRRLISSG